MTAVPSGRAGMGATPYAGGTTFRVWAPNATGVAVTGDFNGWPAAGVPLAGEPSGTWSADVPKAAAGQAYQYLITTGGGVLTRVDPYARQVVNDDGTATKAVIYDHGAFDWGDADYGSPGWSELVIYPDGWLLLRQVNEAVAGSQPWKITIAEDMQGNDWITRPVTAS